LSGSAAQNREQLSRRGRTTFDHRHAVPGRESAHPLSGSPAQIREGDVVVAFMFEKLDDAPRLQTSPLKRHASIQA